MSKEFFAHQALVIDPPSLRAITLQVNSVGGINLGQGVCQLPVPDEVADAARAAVADGVNRYTNPRGLDSLRQALAIKLRHFNKVEANPETEILITVGSTGAFEGVCATLLDPGDEVVSFTPYYPYHHNTLKRYSANINYVRLNGDDFQIDLDELAAAFSEKTKFVVVNTPGNPTGKVFTETELKAIAELCERYDCLVVTDEIYEYMVFDGRRHISPASLPELANRTITIGGYSKTFAITGWRIGYAVLPEALASKMAPLIDSIYVCAPAPLQQAVACGIEHFRDDFYQDLQNKYQHKRDFFSEHLSASGLKPITPQGSYYLIADYRENFGKTPSPEFVSNMIEKVKVGAVPSTDFVEDASNAYWIRFCLSVEDSVLEEAIKQLGSL